MHVCLKQISYIISWILIIDSNPSLNLLTSGDVKETVSANDAPAPNDSVPNDSAPDDSAKPSSPSKASLLDVVIDIILNESDEKDKYPDEIRSNACMFLEKASRVASGPRKYIEYKFKNSKIQISF